MPSVKSSTIRRPAPAWQNLSELRQTADRSVLATANVRAKWRVLIANVETPVLDLVALWPIAMSLITCPLAHVASVTRAIHLFSVQSCPVSL